MSEKRERGNYYKEQYAKHREYRKRYSIEYNKKMKLAIHALLGDTCIKCGFSDWRALQIDHINGGGHKEKVGMTKNYYKTVLEKILSGSEEYQLLCANCNWIKRYENKETA